jgi:hypothetical protein
MLRPVDSMKQAAAGPWAGLGTGLAATVAARGPGVSTHEDRDYHDNGPGRSGLR